MDQLEVNSKGPNNLWCPSKETGRSHFQDLFTCCPKIYPFFTNYSSVWLVVDLLRLVKMFCANFNQFWHFEALFVADWYGGTVVWHDDLFSAYFFGFLKHFLKFLLLCVSQELHYYLPPFGHQISLYPLQTLPNVADFLCKWQNRVSHEP